MQRIIHGIAASLLCALLACSAQSGNSEIASPTKTPHEAGSDARQAPEPIADDSVHTEASTPRPDTPSAAPVRRASEGNPGPVEEIVLELPLPAASGEGSAASALPEDSAELKKRAKEELALGNTDDALSIIDVLLVIDHDDAELLEIRGSIMMKQGLTEDAAVDFKRCCGLGRSSCCR